MRVNRNRELFRPSLDLTPRPIDIPLYLQTRCHHAVRFPRPVCAHRRRGEACAATRGFARMKIDHWPRPNLATAHSAYSLESLKSFRGMLIRAPPFISWNVNCIYEPVERDKRTLVFLFEGRSREGDMSWLCFPVSAPARNLAKPFLWTLKPMAPLSFGLKIYPQAARWATADVRV